MADGPTAGRGVPVATGGRPAGAAGARVALLTNFVPPYRTPVLRALGERVGALRILVSTAMEGNRSWIPDWEGLDVRVQRGVSIPRRWRHPGGFTERLAFHVPLDTGRRLDELDPDVVIAAEMGPRTTQAAWWTARRRRPLVIWATLSERTEAGRGPVRRLLRRGLLARAAAVVVNGESGAAYIRSFGFPEDRIHRVNQASPVGLGSEPERPDAGDDDAPLHLLVVGQIVERKGIEPFLEGLRAWCESRSAPLRLTVVGTGPLAGRLQAVDPGPLLQVRLEGDVPFEALASRYAAADVLAFPTLADEWGLVVNEAMASGLPVLGSVHAQAVTELVEDGRTGWRYDPERPGALAAALDRMAAASREEIRRQGSAARQRVAALTPATMADRLSHAIEDVLARDRPRS